MRRHLLLNVVLPALALLGIAITLGSISRVFSQLAEKPTEQQIQDVNRQLENNQLSAERLKMLVIDTTRARKEADQSASELVRFLALAILFSGGWLVVGCYQLMKKAQQGAPDDGPRPAGSARS